MSDRSPDHLCSVMLECGHWQKDDVVETHPQFDTPDEPVWCHTCNGPRLMEEKLREEIYKEWREAEEREWAAQNEPPEWW